MLNSTSLGVSFITKYFCPHRQSAPQSAFNLCGCFNKTCIQTILVTASRRNRGWHPWEHLGLMKFAVSSHWHFQLPRVCNLGQDYARNLRKWGSHRKCLCFGYRGPWAAKISNWFKGFFWPESSINEKGKRVTNNMIFSIFYMTSWVHSLWALRSLSRPPSRNTRSLSPTENTRKLF